MNLALPPGSSDEAYARVRARCEQLAMPVWRCNPVGVILQEPTPPGLVGLWLRAPSVSKLISSAVADIAGHPEPPVVDLFPGCWLVLMPEMHRRRLSGYSVAMAMGPAALDDEAFVRSCAAAHIEVPSTRRCLRERANHDRPGVERIATMLRWMLDDLGQVIDHDETISGFTSQLTNAYETIDLLYALGHAMSEPNDPEQFVRLAIDRLHETGDFAWIATAFVDDDELAPGVAGRFLVTGNPTMAHDALADAARGLIEQLGHPGERHIASDTPDFTPDGGPQVIVQPVLRSGKPAGYLLAGEKGGDDPQVSSYDTHLFEATAGYLAPFLENTALYIQQQRMFLGTIEALSASIDAKDPYTCGHSDRVAYLSAQLAGAVGLDPHAVERIHIAGLVHDIGKIGVPEGILTKTGRLTNDEFDAIKLHPEIGHRILRDIPMLQDVLPGVLYHHERWDGRGYPHGLSDDAIPQIARIICLADTFDAMSSTRSYRPAMPRERVLAEIADCAGSQFDPQLAPVFLGLDFATYDRMVDQAAARGSTVELTRPADDRAVDQAA